MCCMSTGEEARRVLPRKISLKWGCLDFVHTVTEIDSSLALTVHPHKVNMDILLQPEFGGGYYSNPDLLDLFCLS